MKYRHLPDNKVHGTNMGPIWGRQDPGGPHVGAMEFAICAVMAGSDIKMIEARASAGMSST